MNFLFAISAKLWLPSCIVPYTVCGGLYNLCNIVWTVQTVSWYFFKWQGIICSCRDYVPVMLKLRAVFLFTRYLQTDDGGFSFCILQMGMWTFYPTCVHIAWELLCQARYIHPQTSRLCTLFRLVLFASQWFQCPTFWYTHVFTVASFVNALHLVHTRMQKTLSNGETGMLGSNVKNQRRTFWAGSVNFYPLGSNEIQTVGAIPLPFEHLSLTPLRCGVETESRRSSISVDRQLDGDTTKP